MRQLHVQGPEIENLKPPAPTVEPYERSARTSRSKMWRGRQDDYPLQVKDRVDSVEPWLKQSGLVTVASRHTTLRVCYLVLTYRLTHGVGCGLRIPAYVTCVVHINVPFKKLMVMYFTVFYRV